MSGPKVFRVVTREEIIAMCQSQLARVDAAAAEWMKAAQQRGAASPIDIETTLARQQALHRLLAEDRFSELQKGATAEISFLQSDAQTRHDRAVAAEVEARQARRRLSRTAQMLLGELDKVNRVVPDELRRILKADKSEADELTSAVERAFRLLSDAAAGPKVTERQRAIAEQLGRGEERVTLAEWIAKQAATASEQNVLQIDQHLASLVALNVDVAPFERRASEISREESSSHRSLLADSLIIDLASTLKSAREREVILGQLRRRRVELSQLSAPQAMPLISEIELALNSHNETISLDLINQADALISDQMRVIAANARRQAVLRGLSSLGYEVNEGMETAWAVNGRVVLRRVASPDYGVELGGGVQSDRLQVRAVAFSNASAQRDARRDRDIETIWCGEFEQLHSLIGRHGGTLEIDKAMPVGAAALKVIEGDASVPSTEIELPEARTLNR